nr:hypothetical protein [Tanacetum cinerariifolium]
GLPNRDERRSAHAIDIAAVGAAILAGAAVHVHGITEARGHGHRAPVERSGVRVAEQVPAGFGRRAALQGQVEGAVVERAHEID